jgi:hypothetical protein
MKFPSNDLTPGEVEKALKSMDEEQHGRKMSDYFPKVNCKGCGIFRTEMGDGLCKVCWNWEHAESDGRWEDDR